MIIDLSSLHYQFITKPLLIGGKAKEYYGVRKAGQDIDFVITEEDYEKLEKQYPQNAVDLWGDKGLRIQNFELWQSITLFDYDFLSKDGVEMEDYKIISLEKLLFLTALASKEQKYQDDLKLIVKKILDMQYKDIDVAKYTKE